MAVLSARDWVRYTPDSYGDAAGAPVYLLAPPTWRERARMRAAESEAGLRYPSDLEVAKAIREAIQEAATTNEAELLATVSAFEEILMVPAPIAPAEGTKEPKGAKKEREETIAHRQAVIDAYNDTADRARAHPRVGALLGRRRLFEEMIFPLRASYMLRGWENVSHPFRLVNGVVPDDVLDAIPEADLKAIGVRASQLVSVSEAQRGKLRLAVAVSRRPADFDIELTPGETWSVLGIEYETNPRDQVEPWAWDVIQTWSMCRGEFGLARLPDAGGLNDQAAWLLDAFNVCTAAEGELKKEPGDEDHGDR